MTKPLCLVANRSPDAVPCYILILFLSGTGTGSTTETYQSHIWFSLAKIDNKDKSMTLGIHPQQPLLPVVQALAEMDCLVCSAG